MKSEAEYKFYALAGGPVQRPGIVRVAEGGAAIDMEVWEMPAQYFGSRRRRHPRAAGHRQGEAGRRQLGQRVRVRGDRGGGRDRDHAAGELAGLVGAAGLRFGARSWRGRL